MRWHHALLYSFGAVFTLAALGIILLRSGMSFDRRRRLVVKWYGVAVPMKRTEYHLDDFQKVTLGRETSSGKSSTTVLFPVWLAGPPAKELAIDPSQDYQVSRRLAEDIARHLGFPLADSSSGDEVVREAANLDEPLRDQLPFRGTTSASDSDGIPRKRITTELPLDTCSTCTYIIGGRCPVMEGRRP